MDESKRAALAAAAIVMAKAHEKAVSRKLLSSERSTLRLVRGAARDVIDRVTADVAASSEFGGSSYNATALRLRIRNAMPAMVLALTGAIEDGRQATRDVAVEDIEESTGDDIETPDASTSDHSYAYATAASLTAAWGGLTMRQVDVAHRKGLSVAYAVRSTAPALEPRLRRAAVTETALAFNDERSAALVAANETRSVVTAFRTQARAVTIEDELGPQYGRIWSAILDMKVCPECAGMDGTAVGLSDEFPGGDPPRHPFCRCIWVSAPLWLPVDEMKRRWLKAA